MTAEPEATTTTTATSERPPRRRPEWVSWLWQGLLVLAVYLAFRAFQLGDAAEGAAPALDGPSVAGGHLALADVMDGEPVLVHFWATWCGVCRAMEGNLEGAARDGRVLSVAVSSGSEADVAHWLREHDMWSGDAPAMPVVVDPRARIARDWGVHAFPTSFWLDGEGRIRHREVGYTTTLGLRARLWLAGL